MKAKDRDAADLWRVEHLNELLSQVEDSIASLKERGLHVYCRLESPYPAKLEVRRNFKNQSKKVFIRGESNES